MHGKILLAVSALFLVTALRSFRAQNSPQGSIITTTDLFPTATPQSLDFGGTAPGTTTSGQSVILSNSTNHLFPVKMSVTGPFLITNNTCGKFIDVGSSCQVALAFSPVTPGNFLGTLSFFPAEPSQVVSLSGSAPQLETSSVSRVVNIADLPDVQPLPPGTPAAPTGDEEGSSGTTGPVGTLPPGATQASATLSVGIPANNLSVGPSFSGLSYINQGRSASLCALFIVLCLGSSNPDTQIALGPDHLVQAVNRAYVVFDKRGNRIMGPKSLFDLFGVSGNLSDPIVRFDAGSARWFIVTTTWADDCSSGAINLAVSTGSDPTAQFRIFNVSVANLPDFPKIGISDDKVVITADAWNPCDTFKGTEFTVFDKAGLTSGGPLLFHNNFLPLKRGDGTKQNSIAPAQSLSSVSTLYMAARSSATTLDVWSLNGVPGSGNGTTFPPIDNVPLKNRLLPPPPAVQQGTNLTVQTNDNKLLDAFFRNATLWVSANDGCTPTGDTTQRSCLRFVQIDTATMTHKQDFDFGTVGGHYYYPAIRPDSSGDLIAVFSGSSSSQYPSLYAGASLSPNFGSLQNLTLLHAGDFAYTQMLCINPSGSPPCTQTHYKG
jgi:hypothetical protein